jgi:hypothetical protein
MPERDKRQLRNMKRVLKRRGNKHRRQKLKRELAENPEDAAHADEEVVKYRSDTLNRLDNDSTRKRKTEEE